MQKRNTIFLLVTAFYLQFTWMGCSSVSTTMATSQAKHSATLMFYNVENLFDTLDDPIKRDEDFLPTSEKAWNTEKYLTKLERLGEVIAGPGEDFPVLVGIAEVENLNALKDLAEAEPLKKAKYEAILREGPDERGIDVGLLYSPKKFKVVQSRSLPVDLPPDDRPTRTILHVHGRLKRGPELHVFVNHWPSRYGGSEASEYKRVAAAEMLREAVESVLSKNPDAYIVCMGDFNDYPENRSLSEVLGAGSVDEPGFLVNLMKGKEEEWRGSYNYRGEWGFLDQIIISPNLVDGIAPDVAPDKSGPYFTEEMMYVNDKGEEYPSRTYGGNNYFGGYSDHLPVYTILKY